MKQSDLTFALVSLVTLTAIAAILALVFSGFLDFQSTPPIPSQSRGAAALTIADQPPVIQSEGVPVYSPPRPEEAPEDIREAVMLGYNIIVDTKTYAGEYVGNDLNCTNCHFNGGMNHAGHGGGLSLVGVAAKYPKYRSRREGSADLVQRTNGCFERSQNGKALPPNSDEMIALMTYYHWISKGVPIYADIPWLGLQKFPDAAQKGNIQAGTDVYGSTCAPCHGPDGQGTTIAPPLWGPGSYNDGAGMSRPDTLAPFALLNMPKGNPTLTKDQAMDVATYVNNQPRPHFSQSQGSSGQSSSDQGTPGEDDSSNQSSSGQNSASERSTDQTASGQGNSNQTASGQHQSDQDSSNQNAPDNP